MRPLVCAVVLGVSACGAASEKPASAPSATGSVMNSVVSVDEHLAPVGPLAGEGDVVVDQHASERSATGALKVVVVLRNKTSAPLGVQVRARFYDQNRVAEDAPSEWQAMMLPSGGANRFAEAALSASAAHYVVEVRRAEGR